MLSYEQFLEEVKTKVKDFLPEKYQNAQVTIKKIDKVNGTYDMLVIDLGKDAKQSPAMNLTLYYENYQQNNSEDLESVLRDCAKKMEEAFDNMPDFSGVMNELNMDKIIPQVINTEWNKELIEGVPHRQFHDLSIIYRLIVNINEMHMVSSCLINNYMAEVMGLTEEELYEKTCFRKWYPMTLRCLQSQMSQSF